MSKTIPLVIEYENTLDYVAHGTGALVSLCSLSSLSERNRLFKKKVPQRVPRPDSCVYIDDRFMADEEARRERLVSSCYAASMI